jgi:hypothetical protein
MLEHSYFGGLQAPNQVLVGTGTELSEKKYILYVLQH